MYVLPLPFIPPTGWTFTYLCVKTQSVGLPPHHEALSLNVSCGCASDAWKSGLCFIGWHQRGGPSPCSRPMSWNGSIGGGFWAAASLCLQIGVAIRDAGAWIRTPVSGADWRKAVMCAEDPVDVITEMERGPLPSARHATLVRNWEVIRQHRNQPVLQCWRCYESNCVMILIIWEQTVSDANLNQI